LPVVPIRIHGTREILPIGSMYIRTGIIDLTISKPIPTTGMTVKDVDLLAEKVRSRIAGVEEPQHEPEEQRIPI